MGWMLRVQGSAERPPTRGDVSAVQRRPLSTAADQGDTDNSCLTGTNTRRIWSHHRSLLTPIAKNGKGVHVHEPTGVSHTTLTTHVVVCPPRVKLGRWSSRLQPSRLGQKDYGLVRVLVLQLLGCQRCEVDETKRDGAAAHHRANAEATQRCCSRRGRGEAQPDKEQQRHHAWTSAAGTGRLQGGAAGARRDAIPLPRCEAGVAG